ncbi:MAG TPA: MFS transporter [Candidatus Limnocylindrales bacterium]|nr:MFS transporter [Candidatus Limnocylindrales bacterium]
MSASTPAAIPHHDPAHDPNLRTRAKGAWAIYDFANTIFSFAIVSGAIGLWLTDDSRFGEASGQAILSIAIIISVGLNAIVSPVLGALSDRGGRRLPFLLAFTALCIGPTAVIGFTGPLVGVLLFILANFSYQAALIYYDASIKLVSTPSTRGRLSGIGTGIGYCGTVFIGLLIQFGQIDVEDRFLVVAVLYALFAIPLFVIVKEHPELHGEKLTTRMVGESWRQLSATIRHAQEVPGLSRFLLGRFFYSDAVNTLIVVMSVVAVEAVGLDSFDANLLLLTLTLVAIVMSFVWGWMTDRLGPRRTLIIVLLSWAVGLVLGVVSLSLNATDPVTGAPVPTAIGLAFFVIAGAILGSGLGGVSVADRVFMVRLSPPERIGEFFGIYGLVGKASQVIGQALYGAIIFLFLSTLGVVAYQVAILSLILTMFIGLWLVWPVSDTWAGSGEIHDHAGAGGPHVLSEEDLVAAHEAGHVAEGEEPGHSVAPPARLSPDRAPLGDRDSS